MPDLTVEQMITKTIVELARELAYSTSFTLLQIQDIVTAATPEIVKHYLKGQ